MDAQQAEIDTMKRAAKIMNEAEVPMCGRTICYQGVWYTTDENGNLHSDKGGHDE
jgi:hypothetical protein